MEQFTETDIKLLLQENNISIELALHNLSVIGLCPNLLNDDNDHWAVAYDGFQSLPQDDNPDDVVTTVWIEKRQWKKTIREALIYSLEDETEV